MALRFGSMLPAIRSEVPGPASRALAARLGRVESRNITRVADDAPIFWAEARGANVRDADGNVYIDLTAGFGVAAAGHANRAVTRSAGQQLGRLAHALGDVHPADVKVALLERLAALAPADLGVSVLAGGGSEAVEAAFKTAALRTGRHGVLAFTGAYHGLTYGALAATWRSEFRSAFAAQLGIPVRFAPFPNPYRPPATLEGVPPRRLARAALDAVEREMSAAAAAGVPIGAIIVEPVQGRGGIVVPPRGFLAGLRELCDGFSVLLVMDEVYTGLGRTGRWFACQHEDVVPDILVVGKALGGGLPLSAAIGTPEVMAAWPPSAGEAMHTSTFLGNPVACAAALAHLHEIERRGLVRRAERCGRALRRRLDSWKRRFPVVGEVRGLGLMQGVELVQGPERRKPAAAAAARVVAASLRRGVLLLTEGPDGNVLAFTPPFVITRRQLSYALDAVESALEAEAGGS